MFNDINHCTQYCFYYYHAKDFRKHLSKKKIYIYIYLVMIEMRSDGGNHQFEEI